MDFVNACFHSCKGRDDSFRPRELHNSELVTSTLSRRPDDACFDDLFGSVLNTLPVDLRQVRLLTASHDCTARLWSVASGDCVCTFMGHRRTVYAASFTADGGSIVTASDDATVRFWDAQTGECTKSLEGHTGTVLCLSISEDGLRIATGSHDTTARIWDINSGGCCAACVGHGAGVVSVAFSSDTSLVITGSFDHTAHLWHAEDGSLIRVIRGHLAAVYSVDFLRNGPVLTASLDGSLRIWDVLKDREECLRTIEGHERGKGVLCAKFSADGARILSSSHDHTARLWEVASGACLALFTGHTGSVYSVAFSPSEALVATASFDGTARVWDPATGTCVRTLPGHSAGLLSAAFESSATQER